MAAVGIDDKRADAVAHALAALGAIAKHPEWPMRSAGGVAEIAIREIHALCVGENVTPRFVLERRIRELANEVAGCRDRIARCGLEIAPRESTSDWLAQVLQVLLIGHGTVQKLDQELTELRAWKEGALERIQWLEERLRGKP
jgi:hypothetical protein